MDYSLLDFLFSSLKPQIMEIIDRVSNTLLLVGHQVVVEEHFSFLLVLVLDLVLPDQQFPIISIEHSLLLVFYNFSLLKNKLRFRTDSRISPGGGPGGGPGGFLEGTGATAL